jgi:hypothetical protein
MTYLFLVKDIENVCIQKYGSKEAYQKIMNDKLTKKKEKQDRIVKSKEAWRKELNHYLKSIGLNGVRSDSSLCDNYINHGPKSGFTKEEIGEIMLEMKFYYDHTNYRNILHTMRREEIADMRDYGGYYVWTDADEEELRDDAKLKALYDYVSENFDDTHKCIIEIPLSLKSEYDLCYEKIKKLRTEQHKKMIEKIQRMKNQLSITIKKHHESKNKFNGIFNQYQMLLKDIGDCI